MPLINTNFDDLSSVDPERAENINEILLDAGLPPAKLNPRNNETDVLKKSLNRAGASIQDASKTIANVMKSGRFENSRLKAAEIVLDLHGVRDKEGKVLKQPIFQFFIKDSSVNIDPIFSPIRTALPDPSSSPDLFGENENNDD